ncbi:hypothetical protein [Cedecea colo]|uniref:Phage protein n=1 Tax=Cedecea colo TaxID=2552946 RepID=A0ABX0VQE2_9ENTR|nr:hypothetical protein [Cedecea colo]NIY49309.1 hypothetical protein [Cedecea colo]
MNKLSNEHLEAIRVWLKQEAHPLRETATGAQLAQCDEALGELLLARQKIEILEKQLSTPVRLPPCSSSPVCEIDAAYSNGVNDSKEAIRRAGYPIEGDD